MNQLRLTGFNLLTKLEEYLADLDGHLPDHGKRLLVLDPPWKTRGTGPFPRIDRDEWRPMVKRLIDFISPDIIWFHRSAGTNHRSNREMGWYSIPFTNAAESNDYSLLRTIAYTSGTKGGLPCKFGKHQIPDQMMEFWVRDVHKEIKTPVMNHHLGVVTRPDIYPTAKPLQLYQAGVSRMPIWAFHCLDHWQLIDPFAGSCGIARVVGRDRATLLMNDVQIDLVQSIIDADPVLYRMQNNPF
jgi:hypothetical protein